MKKNKKTILYILLAVLALQQSLVSSKVSANSDIELTDADTTEKQVTSEEILSTEDILTENTTENSYSTDTTTEDVTTEKSTSVTDVTTEKSTLDNTTEQHTTTEERITTEDDKKNKNEDKKNNNQKTYDINNLLNYQFKEKKESVETQGMRYYVNKYLEERELEYLNVYKDYMDSLEAAGASLYELGEITELEYKNYSVQKDLVNAQIQAANNSIKLYQMFIDDNNLKFDNFNINEDKPIKNIDEYVEEYPDIDKMTVANCITEYDNASLYIEPKKSELSIQKMKYESMTISYELGEISELDLKQQAVAVEKVKLEIEQYYANRNLAYINILGLIDKEMK